MRLLQSLTKLESAFHRLLYRPWIVRGFPASLNLSLLPSPILSLSNPSDLDATFPTYYVVYKLLLFCMIGYIIFRMAPNPIALQVILSMTETEGAHRRTRSGNTIDDPIDVDAMDVDV